MTTDPPHIACPCGRRHALDVASQTLTIGCACGAVFAAALVQPQNDGRGRLIVLGDGYDGIPVTTLKRWARGGRLKAWELERGKLAAWERDIRAAVESAPARIARPSGVGAKSSVAGDVDPLQDMLDRGEVVAAGR